MRVDDVLFPNLRANNISLAPLGAKLIAPFSDEIMLEPGKSYVSIDGEWIEVEIKDFEFEEEFFGIEPATILNPVYQMPGFYHDGVAASGESNLARDRRYSNNWLNHPMYLHDFNGTLGIDMIDYNMIVGQMGIDKQDFRYQRTLAACRKKFHCLLQSAFHA